MEWRPLKGQKAMALIEGSKKSPRLVNCCAVGCEGEKLDAVLKDLNTDGWSIRQIFQVGLDYYRVFAQRSVELDKG